ncbi:FprA family A-type flavoprotein [Natranaerobius thermophilus]|uniref:Beta-lactamase domain protein n=1 Tax=Natranaerobius thermophilus (strain ATCC BAA-1301 / DSM 18059 / JW/NM-WN-LF) TaxID=457570 RepID=B2A792_NATTJ|nr:FprA family A-type flavoprotein [Natranaerobius thermophilus]ACB84286.1 beta-lactamase domain protein [Natranaerobius thermophilus JW/NM-WN-LF]
MNNTVAITDKISWIGVNDRVSELFEAIWPLPDGVSYNSYLINDEQVALVDTVKDSEINTYLQNIKNVIGNRSVDYLIINHMEPDHSGAIEALRREYPNITLVGNQKTLTFLEQFYGIVENIKIVDDGDQLQLGQHTLNFYLTPMVHWPETMMTYEQKEKILFSGDAFGGFGTLEGGIFDDEVNLDFYQEEIRRYFTNIVAKYGPMVEKAISKLADLDVKIIAATHGPVWREKPEQIIADYSRWSRQETEPGVVVVYGSMYGNTETMVDTICRRLAEKGIKNIKVYNISKTHVSYIINDIWRYQGLILGSCAYNSRIFPPMDYLLCFLENKNIKNRLLGLFGSYTWSGGAMKRLQEFQKNTKLELIEPSVEVKSAPKKKDHEDCIKMAENMAAKLKE